MVILWMFEASKYLLMVVSRWLYCQTQLKHGHEALSNERLFSDKDTLWNFLTAENACIPPCCLYYAQFDNSGCVINIYTRAVSQALFSSFQTSKYMKTPLRLVKEMSGEALQLMSTALGIHLAFWAWVASEQASDGFWLNTHSKSVVGRIYLKFNIIIIFR